MESWLLQRLKIPLTQHGNMCVMSKGSTRSVAGRLGIEQILDLKIFKQCLLQQWSFHCYFNHPSLQITVDYRKFVW